MGFFSKLFHPKEGEPAPEERPAIASQEGVPSSTNRDPADRDTDLSQDLDVAFDSLRHAGADVAPVGRMATDPGTSADVAELFDQMAAMHLRPVQDFLLDLACDQAGLGWLDICRPALRSLAAGAQSMGRSELVQTVQAFERTLADIAAKHTGGCITGTSKEAVFSAARAVATVLPRAFDAEGERDRREPIIVRSLLKKVSGLSHVGVERLFAAGLYGLAAFEKAKVADLMAIAEIERDVATAIVETFASYRKQRLGQASSVAGPVAGEQRRGEFVQMRALATALSRAHAEFEAADAEDDKHAKRKARRERERVLAEIDVVLAHLGELDLITELRRLSVERKVERIEALLAKAKQHNAFA